VLDKCVAVIGFRLMDWGDRLRGWGHTLIFTNADGLGFRLGSVANMNVQGPLVHTHTFRAKCMTFEKMCES
jgi:hypothetical protein